MLDRRDTPWGFAEQIVVVAPGIHFVCTASHGGYQLDPQPNSVIPADWQAATFRRLGERGWYEQDCDWAMVQHFFGHLFPPEAQQDADLTLRWMGLVP